MNAGLLLSGVVGTLMVAWASRNLWREHFQLKSQAAAPKVPGARESRTLKEISHIWGKEVIKLRDIAHIWREMETGIPAGRPRPIFSRKEIDEFFAKHVENPEVKGNRRTVIEKLLTMLDKEGDCPSIVGRGRYENDREPERGYSIERYDCFAKIPLWRHAITVAELYVAKFQYRALVPNALVIALGHDIGAIEAQYERYYRQLTHPEISLLVLKSIPEYTSLENSDEINSIIISHHSLSNLKLAKILKAADQDARNMEFKESLRAPDIENAGEIPGKEKAMLPEEEKEEKEDTQAKGEGDVDPVLVEGCTQEAAHEEKPLTCVLKEKHGPQEIVPLPDWLDFGAILSHMGSKINIMEKTSDLNLGWSAYAVREGYVWVKEELLWEAVLKSSGESAFLAAAREDKALRWNLLYTLVKELGRRGMAAVDLVKEGYFQVPVTILARKRKPCSAFMTPFFPEAFGIPPEELEQRKGSLINDMIRNIVPKQKENPSC